jgi:transposase InsO family protein
MTIPGLCAPKFCDETMETASAFMRNAIAAFAAQGVIIQRVLTDNGSCYRSRAFAFASVLTESGITHKRTRHHRPQTVGKVERFNRILQEEWAYAKAYRSEAERQSCYPDFIEYLNQRRPLTALRGISPVRRVTNQPG